MTPGRLAHGKPDRESMSMYVPRPCSFWKLSMREARAKAVCFAIALPVSLVSRLGSGMTFAVTPKLYIVGCSRYDVWTLFVSVPFAKE